MHLSFFFISDDPCYKYRSLNSADRRLTDVKTEYPDNQSCENELAIDWYRFHGAAGTRMPTKCTQTNRCHTRFPGWLDVTYKPLPQKGRVNKDIKVFFHNAAGNRCCSKSLKIHVKNCTSFFVYRLLPTQDLGCPRRYCGTD